MIVCHYGVHIFCAGWETMSDTWWLQTTFRVPKPPKITQKSRVFAITASAKQIVAEALLRPFLHLGAKATSKFASFYFSRQSKIELPLQNLACRDHLWRHTRSSLELVSACARNLNRRGGFFWIDLSLCMTYHCETNHIA